MSIQIIVSTPYAFIDWLKEKQRRKAVADFYKQLKSVPELALEETYEDEEFFNEDLPVSDSSDLSKWVRAHLPERAPYFDADIYIPNNFKHRIKLRLPVYVSGDTDYYFVSSFVLLRTIEEIRRALGREEASRFEGVMSLFQEAAEVSIKNNQPIFSSY